MASSVNARWPLPVIVVLTCSSVALAARPAQSFEVLSADYARAAYESFIGFGGQMQAEGSPGGHHQTSHDPVDPDEQRANNVAKGIAVMFLGLVLFVCSVAWFMSYPDIQVKMITVRVISSICVIFMAVAVEHAGVITSIIELHTGIENSWLTSLVPFSVYWTLTGFVSFKCRRSHRNIVAASSVLSHIAAFIAIYGMTDILYLFEHGPANGMKKWENAATRAGLWLSFAAFFFILLRLTWIALHYLPFDCELSHDEDDVHSQGSHTEVAGQSSLAKVPESEEVEVEVDTPESAAKFIHEVYEAYEDGALIALSYLLAKFVLQKSLLDCLNLKYAQDSYVNRNNIWVIENQEVGLATGIVLVMGGLVQIALYIVDLLSKNFPRLHSTTMFLSMCLAWLAMRAVRFIVMLFTAQETCIIVVTAYLASAVAGLLVMLIDKIADYELISDRLAEQLCMAYGFMIGFSWEKAFASSMHVVLHDIAHFKRKDRELGASVVVSLCLVLGIFPGWRYMILPHALLPIPPRKVLEVEGDSVPGKTEEHSKELTEDGAQSVPENGPAGSSKVPEDSVPGRGEVKESAKDGKQNVAEESPAVETKALAGSSKVPEDGKQSVPEEEEEDSPAGETKDIAKDDDQQSTALDEAQKA